MNVEQFQSYLAQNANGTRAERLAVYMSMRERLHKLLESRGMTVGTPEYETVLEAFSRSADLNEERHAPPPPEPVKDVSGSRFWRRIALASTAGFAALLVWTVVGTLEGTAQTSGARPQAPGRAEPARPIISELNRRFAEAESTFEENAKAIRAIAAAIDAVKRRDGRVPQSGGTFVLWPTVAEKDELLAKTAMVPKTPRGTIIYRSDGAQNYKVLMVQTGDCVVALLKNPELVDPPRSGTLLDCTYYGRWTPDAANW